MEERDLKEIVEVVSILQTTKRRMVQYAKGDPEITQEVENLQYCLEALHMLRVPRADRDITEKYYRDNPTVNPLLRRYPAPKC